jgi:hypothetical protein
MRAYHTTTNCHYELSITHYAAKEKELPASASACQGEAK